jgi:alkanesulfonate monooxygenase SsuD/methylene tetrahydromethanopterin reductase-like flavin-dependent oxidoreductase (luciferase family)
MEDRARADPIAVLGAMAAVTSTLKIGVVPLVASLRNPSPPSIDSQAVVCCGA